MLGIQSYFNFGANFNIPGFGDFQRFLLGVSLRFPCWGLLAFYFIKEKHQSQITYTTLGLVADCV